MKQKYKPRNKLIDFLRNNNVDGWFSTVENVNYFEVCLFTKNIQQMYILKKVTDGKIINSLDDFKPVLTLGTTNKLSDNNNKKLSQRYHNFLNETNPSERYSIGDYMLSRIYHMNNLLMID